MHGKSSYQNIKYIFVALALLFIACENDIEKIRSLTSMVEYPDLSGKDVRVVYSDSTIKKLEIKAPTVLQFSTVEEPYTEFPDGINVKFFDETETLESQITADKAVYKTELGLWEANENVFARNFITGEKLTTDQLFWDEKKEIVYSEMFTKIETDDGVFYGEEGFEADQNLNKWVLKGSTGIVNVSEDETEGE